MPANVKAEAHVSIGPPSEGPKPFAIAVDLIITSDAKGAEEKKKLQDAVEKAHEVRARMARMAEVGKDGGGWQGLQALTTYLFLPIPFHTRSALTAMLL